MNEKTYKVVAETVTVDGVEFTKDEILVIDPEVMDISSLVEEGSITEVEAA